MVVEPYEIERKYLVETVPNLGAAQKTLIRQGYLTQSDDSIEVRLRQKDDSYFLTVKSGEGMVRTEREIKIDGAQFSVLWPCTMGRKIEKERWTGTLSGDQLFELDIFKGPLAPLMLVEVEFTSIEQADGFEPPAWFGREVTLDKRYKNKSLATGDATRALS